MKYNYKKLDIKTYIDSLYADGVQKSNKLNDEELTEIILNIGIFKFKGYVKAFRNGLSQYTFDDLLSLYDTDREISLNMFALTSKIEIKLKAYLVETVYELTENPFFYLLKESYKEDFNMPNDSLHDWEVKVSNTKQKSEIYMHYRDYYLSLYDYESNKSYYLKDKELIYLNVDKDINYPPFHYFIESATLGTIIYIISKLQIEGHDILKLLAKKFNVYMPHVFLTYLLRLKEVRNRCAHSGRLINRNFWGIKASGLHSMFRKTIYEHKLIDVYYTLHFLLDDTKKFKTVDDLVDSFIADNLSNCEVNIREFVIGFLKTR